MNNKNVQIRFKTSMLRSSLPIKNLSTFWRARKMPLISCEINLSLNWSKDCVILVDAAEDQSATFSITDTKLYVPVVTLSTQDNAKPFEQVKSGFKRTINWKKYLSKISTETQN